MGCRGESCALECTEGFRDCDGFFSNGCETECPTSSLRDCCTETFITGALVGIGLGVAVVLLAVGLVGFFIYSRRKRRDTNSLSLLPPLLKAYFDKVTNPKAFGLDYQDDAYIRKEILPNSPVRFVGFKSGVSITDSTPLNPISHILRNGMT